MPIQSSREIHVEVLNADIRKAHLIALFYGLGLFICGFNAL